MPVFPDADLTKEAFSGGKRLAGDSADPFPYLFEMLNALRKIAGGRVGSDTIANGTAAKAVTFATAFPAGTTVKIVGLVPRADITNTNSIWVDTVSETGFTVKTTGNVGADIDFDYLAVAE